MKKRLMSILLCFFLCVTWLPISAQAGETDVAKSPEIPTEGDVWDGSINRPTKLVQKDGVYYYEITKCSELAYVAQIGEEWLGYNYIIANNLILNDVILIWDEEGNCINDEELLEWIPIDNYTGIFDGNGYCVSGLYLCNPEQYYQGFMGFCYGDIRNLHITNSHIEGAAYVGGLAADCYSYSEVSNCSFSGTVIGEGYVGGIVGSSQDLSYCTANGFVKGSYYVGGIAGDSNVGSQIVSCNNNSTIIGIDYPVASHNIGGIVGTHLGKITYCSNRGDVVGGESVGGIAGRIYDASITKSMNVGVVKGINNIGGIAGKLYQSAQISACSNSGAVSGTTCVGGIAAFLQGDSRWTPSVINCYNIAKIAAIDCAGGVCGEVVDGNLSFCYSIGIVNSDSGVGGIVGKSDHIWGRSELCSNYYLANNQFFGCGNLLEDSIGQYESKNSIALKKQETYAEWDYDKVWNISITTNESYPYLQWQEDIFSNISVNKVEINETELSMQLGDYAYLVATISPANASNKSITWHSSDSDIATVSAAGKVTAVSAGTAIVTVITEDGGYTATCIVTVTERLAEEYKINSITIRDSDGKLLSEIPSGSCLATVSITNLASAGNTLVFLAAYTPEGRYHGMIWISVEDLPVGATIKVTIPINNSDGKIENLKAFTVASFSNLTPLGEAVSFLQ